MFRRLARGGRNIKVILTGMGKRNAGRAMRAALEGGRPGLVLSCGFAGGLRPGLGTGDVVFSTDPGTGLEPALLAAGAEPGRFHCAERVAVTAAEKRALREATGADAVEMESGSIRAVCQEQRIPCAIVRVILDTASEDLPLDFNRLMTRDQRLDSAKLALALLKSPGKVSALRRLQRHSNASAEKLARVVATVLGAA